MPQKRYTDNKAMYRSQSFHLLFTSFKFWKHHLFLNKIMCGYFLFVTIANNFRFHQTYFWDACKFISAECQVADLKKPQNVAVLWVHDSFSQVWSRPWAKPERCREPAKAVNLLKFQTQCSRKA
jgi:hypothetical protein